LVHFDSFLSNIFKTLSRSMCFLVIDSLHVIFTDTLSSIVPNHITVIVATLSSDSMHAWCVEWSWAMWSVPGKFPSYSTSEVSLMLVYS
jgi:hypothetical protein